MKTVNIHDAKTNFSKLINAVSRGEEVVIAKAGKPLAKIIAYEEKLEPRKGGQFKGLIHIADDFDEPLPADLLKQFYQGDE